MTPDGRDSAALESSWNRQAAEASLERWLQVCTQEGWGQIPENRERLISIFGASWYFTRFIFYRGAGAAAILDADLPALADPDGRVRALSTVAGGTTAEQSLEALRVAKNDQMLGLLAAWLDGSIGQEALEQALTRLAEAVVDRMLVLFNLKDADAGPVAVLGMGRLAGAEMNFGSDLDLIFLHDAGDTDAAGAISRSVRLLLRNIAAASAAGSLYDVDMRLRPHGTSGALITSRTSFVEYHCGERETWERQMMTRCRPVTDGLGLGASAMQAVLPCVYAERTAGPLRREIRDMRARVERELGRPQGRFELKRGRGGLMDIDFITHFLQLQHGGGDAALQVCSTREALRAARAGKRIAPEDFRVLLEGYEFLKRIETCLRLFDVKSISAFPNQPGAAPALVRAMGFAADGERFIDRYVEVTGRIREVFDGLLGPA